jgi:hypothetical protein
MLAQYTQLLFEIFFDVANETRWKNYESLGSRHGKFILLNLWHRIADGNENKKKSIFTQFAGIKLLLTENFHIPNVSEICETEHNVCSCS